ncbi:hypothetical protein AAG596_07170 [Citromicrobium bathyomarinum]|uniref:hypothetical protein n=1 Tax=Citromicrobium bathyomarinum TaxID=72174 RepID=UPI00315A2AF3
MPKSAKVGFGLLLLHAAAFVFVAIVQPEYDGQDLPAFIFLVVLSNVLPIVGGLFLLFSLLRWFVTRPNN